MHPTELVERLRRAVDDHDIDALAGCFASTYVNETPAHPARSFEGDAQVRANWTRIFAGVPDMRGTVLATAIDGDIVWSEWELAGTRADGVPQTLRGVIIFVVSGDRFASARFYLEPVDAGDDGVEAAVGRIADEPS